MSQQVLPGFRILDPGQFDLIEVGAAPGTMVAAVDCPGPQPCPEEEHIVLVPFRVEPIGGGPFRGRARLSDLSGAWQVVGVDRAKDVALQSNGGQAIAGMSDAAWAGGVATALVLIAVALLLMVVIQRTTRSATR